jgi:hypothetical protein
MVGWNRAAPNWSNSWKRRRRHVDAGDWLGGHYDAANGGWRLRNRIGRALVKPFGVGEEERCVPTEQHEAGDQSRLRIALDV